jgi:hypothetical protein
MTMCPAAGRLADTADEFERSLSWFVQEEIIEHEE